MQKHFEITRFIHEMEVADLIWLGQALGLSRPKLQKMRDMPGDMIAAWLRQEDHVIEKTGDPTWRKLADALQSINQAGIAGKIREAKNILVRENTHQGM